MRDIVFFLAALTLLAGSAVFADAGFFIGEWLGPTEIKREKFAELAGANFTIAMIQSDSAENNIEALDLCQATGMKGLVVDPRIRLNDRKDDWTSDLDGVLNDYSGHPALWGYFITDEPNADSFNDIAETSDYLSNKDPNHTPYVNLFPTYASKEQLGAETYEHHVDEFCRLVKPKMISYDHYALMADGTTRPDYFTNLAIIRKQAIKHRTPFTYILLSVPHGPYADPNGAQIRWQVSTALAYGAKGLMYFTYMTPDDPQWNYHDAIIDANGKPTEKYEIAKKVNGEVLKLGPTLMRLRSTAVYHTGQLPDDCKPLPEDGLIKAIKGGEFVVGQFLSDDNHKYAMIVNRSYEKGASAKIVFSQKTAVYETSPVSGKEQAINLSSHDSLCVWDVRFKPGEGKLIRIEVLGKHPVINWEDKLVFRPRLMLNPSNQFGNRIYGENNEELYCEGMNMYLIAERVQKILQADGRIDVFMSRNTQTQHTTLGEEMQITRSLNCDLVYALHSDATGTSDPGKGTWTFYKGEDGKRFADLVQNELMSAMRTTFYPDAKDMGVRMHWYHLYVLHHGGCQGALTEFLFHTNPQEREMLKDPAKQDIMAQAVSRGILKYFFGD